MKATVKSLLVCTTSTKGHLHCFMLVQLIFDILTVISFTSGLLTNKIKNIIDHISYSIYKIPTS